MPCSCWAVRSPPPWRSAAATTAAPPRPGAGLVVGGSLSYSLPAWGLTLTAAGQGLVVHEQAGFREWGVAGTVLFDPGAPGRGIALRVAPSWGTAAAGGGERLWSLADASALAATDRFHPAARLDAELSYGLDAPGGDGALIPYAAVALAAGGERTWRLGSRLSIDPGFSLNLEGTRTEPAGAAHAPSTPSPSRSPCVPEAGQVAHPGVQPAHRGRAEVMERLIHGA